MKKARIYPYNKTKGERHHQALVIAAKNNGFKHPGSKTLKCLIHISKGNIVSKRKSFLNSLLGM